MPRAMKKCIWAKQAWKDMAWTGWSRLASRLGTVTMVKHTRLRRPKKKYTGEHRAPLDLTSTTMLKLPMAEGQQEQHQVGDCVIHQAKEEEIWAGCEVDWSPRVPGQVRMLRSERRQQV